MRKKISVKDIIGKQFGQLLILEYFFEKNHKYKCLCDCGNTTIALRNNLLSGSKKSCGCLLTTNNKKGIIDLTNQKFGKLTVIDMSDKPGSHRYWNCKCDCGTVKVISGANLRRGISTSCGCFIEKFNLVGKQFDRLIVIKKTENTKKYRGQFYTCLCICGKYKNILARSLISGKTRSCGCLAIENNKRDRSGYKQVCWFANRDVKCFIYILQNNINNKIYVGFTTNPAKRWAQEKRNAFNKKAVPFNYPISKAIRKHGWDNFTKFVIEEHENVKEGFDAESFWIAFFKTNINKHGKVYGYNLTDGNSI